MMIDIYILTIAIILLMTITLDTQIRLEEVRDYYLRRIIYRERKKKCYRNKLEKCFFHSILKYTSNLYRE